LEINRHKNAKGATPQYKDFLFFLFVNLGIFSGFSFTDIGKNVSFNAHFNLHHCHLWIADARSRDSTQAQSRLKQHQIITFLLPS
jgi:hypothetical protein